MASSSDDVGSEKERFEVQHLALARWPTPGTQRARKLWQAELEFVQSLANPEYLHYLAQNRYLDDPAFVEHIDYLRYWAGEKYCHYIVFPHCLRMLELLQQPSFRAALKRADFKEMVFRQQHYAWRYRGNPTAPPADAAPDPLLVSQSETPQVTIPAQ